MTGLTVFVTGAGALVGQGILRSLRMSGRRVRIVTGDPDARATGHWLGDCAYTIPRAVDPQFVSRVEDILVRERVDVVLVGTDVELPVLSRERPRLEAAHGVRIAVSAPDVVEVADDKWRTARFLEAEGFPFPGTALAGDREAMERLVETRGFPLFAKPRRGARSVGAGIVANRAALAAVSRASDVIVQDLLPDDEGEFTAGCLVSGCRCASVVVLRRDLRDGNTYRAYWERDRRFDTRMAEIAERLGVEGPCNLQFRVRDGEPVVFEINARFSGTTPIRAIFGFNEVDALVGHLAYGTPIPTPELREGVVLRAWSDVFLERSQLDELATSGRLESPACESVPFLATRAAVERIPEPTREPAPQRW